MPGRDTHRRRRTVAAPLAVVVGASSLLLGGTAQAQQAAPPSTLRVAISQDIDSLNPFLAVRLSSTQVGRLTYEYLTQAGRRGPTGGRSPLATPRSPTT